MIFNQLASAASISLLACTTTQVPVSHPPSTETPKAMPVPLKTLPIPESRPPAEAPSSSAQAPAPPPSPTETPEPMVKVPIALQPTEPRPPEQVPFRFGSLVLTPSQKKGYVVGSFCLATPGMIGVYDPKTKDISCVEEATCKLLKASVENSLVIGSHACFEKQGETETEGFNLTATVVIIGLNQATKMAEVILDMGDGTKVSVPRKNLKIFAHCRQNQQEP